VIVEPHADDAFLSLGGHLERWQKAGVAATIVTVFSATRKRGAEALAYANAVGASWVGLGLDHGQEGLDELLELPPGNLVLPLGLTHPEHVWTRVWFEEAWLRAGTRSVFYYLDQPYAIAAKNSDLVTARLAGMEVVSYLKPHARKYRHIPLFKDQAKFYHFNPAERLGETSEWITRRYAR
jgi:hypothetical protein